MFCRKCGKQIPDNTKFCIFCGAPVQQGADTQGYTPGSGSGSAPGRRPPSKGSGKKVILVICSILAAILIVGAAVFAIKTITSKDDPLYDRETEEILEEETEEEETEKETEPEAETFAEPEYSVEAAEEIAETDPVPATTAPSESVPNTTQYPTYFVVNCQEFITLRSEPSTSASALRQIPYGSPVSYIETSENGFYKIIYNGQTGYALASYLSTEKPDPRSELPSESSQMTAQVVNCQEWISLRVSPSTKADRILTIPLGLCNRLLYWRERRFLADRL